MQFLLLSAALFGASFVLWWLSRRQTLKAMEARFTPEFPVKQLEEDAAAVAAELGSGAFRQPVIVHGTIRCDHPLAAELTKTPCVAYKFSVTREYEEVVWSTDDKGNQISTRQRRSEELASNERHTSFDLQDSSGAIRVFPDKAKLELVKSHSSFEPAPLAAFSQLTLTGPHRAGDTLGYRYDESCLSVGAEISVYAEASDVDGTLVLRKPEAKDALFIVSPRSLQELAQGVKTSAVLLFGSSIGVALLAGVVLMLGVIR